ncbi:DEAD/DEAH box helicase [bacterium]|nr:DEAD/DEAH box helicase [bacterium]
MKILPVTPLKLQRTEQPKIKASENKQISNFGLNTLPSGFLGKDLLSFKARRFYDTVKENYYKLGEGFHPDKFQVEAGQHLNNDKSVLVTAPTGTGKTAIAHYAVSKNMNEGKKTFYTTPLKALSNQKYREFQEVWGKDNVGILTGDRKENPDAPILIMTTEVFRNMAMSRYFGQKADLMDNLGTVIFDEFHYLGDYSRGPVWEESVIFTPKDVQTLALSATVGNPEKLTDWLNSLQNKKSELVYVPPENRHVPLEFKTFQTNNLNIQKKMVDKNPRSLEVKAMMRGAFQDNPEEIDFKNITSLLKNKNQLPSIYFVFSRKNSFSLVEYLGKKGEDLTSDDEKSEIRSIMEKYQAKNFSSLDTKALLNGYAVHNAGILPDQKAMIEELFQKKLVKVVVATETLGAGINMPAKTVVISQCTKPADRESIKTEEKEPFYKKFDRKTDRTQRQEEPERKGHKRVLTANEFHQMAGRAGRRGIDERGYVYVMPSSIKGKQAFDTLISSPSEPISSKLNPDYAFLASVYDYAQKPEMLKEILDKSFYSFSLGGDTSQIYSDAMKKTDLMVKRGFLKNYDDKFFEPTDKGHLLSVIKGYSQLPLSEAVYNKYFDKLTPVALASVVASMANPADSKETAYGVSENNGSAPTSKLENGVSELYYRMLNSLKTNLSYVGDKKFGDFKDMHEITEYLNTIEEPEEDLEEIAQKKAKYNYNLDKLMKLTEKYQSWSLQSIAKSLKEGKTVSVDAMNGCWKKVQENMRKYQGAERIDSRIEQLTRKLSSLDMDSKKGKEKRKFRLEAQDLKYEIELLETIKYLDEHLPSEMSKADKFIKANNLSATSALAKKYTDLFDTASHLEALKVAATGCEQLEKYFESHDVKEEDKYNMSMVKDTMDKMVNLSAQIYSDSVASGLQTKPDGYGKTSMQLVYNFAQLNKINPDSMSNWHQVVGDLGNINENFDEGQLFRSVTQTIDLLSQISEMATEGKQFAQTQEDKQYYSELKNNTAEAIKLLNKYPVVFN